MNPKPRHQLLKRLIAPTMNQALARYLSEVSALKKSQSADFSIARAWAVTRIAGRTIDRVRPADLAEQRDAWLRTLAPATVVRRMALLSHVYTVARKDWGWHELANPVQLVRRPKVDDARSRRLLTINTRGLPPDTPRTELAWLMICCNSEQLPVLVLLARETAMRRGELARLRREWINLQVGSVRLPDTKNGKPRDVPLSPLATELLRRWLLTRPARGSVFTMSPGAITRAFIRARKRARREYEALCQRHGRRPHPAYFNDLRLHDLRHEATTTLAEVFEMHELAKVTGHRDTRMLLRYYHPSARALASKLRKSPLGKKQVAAIREGSPLI